MTTKLTPLRPLRRESSAFVRDRGMRPLIVTLYTQVLALRPKGTRREEVISLDECYSIAVKQRVAREQAARKQRRAANVKAT